MIDSRPLDSHGKVMQTQATAPPMAATPALPMSVIHLLLPCIVIPAASVSVHPNDPCERTSIVVQILKY